MNKIYSSFSKMLILILISYMLNMSPLSAQDYVDDPQFDRVPEWVADSLANRQPKLFSVVTVDGWDNFFIGLDFAEGHISENPTNAREYFSSFNTDAAHYTMDGHDWQDSNPFWGVQIRGDVLTAYDSLGNLYYENLYGSSIQGCKVVVSQDNGQTWGPAVTAISGVDKNWMCADQTDGPYSNYVYTVMTANGGGNLARSIDLGQSFQQMWNFSTQSVPGMMVCVGAEGNTQGGAVYVVTNGGASQASTYTFYRSLDGGQSFLQMSSQNFAGYLGTWVGGRHSVNNMRLRPYPFIAADNSTGPYRGRLYLVYATNDPPGSGNKPDIWCHYSDDGGQNFSGALRVNDDLIPQANHQFQPAIWCDKTTGRLYIQWMDTRDDPVSQDALIYATYSDDGGESFMPSKAISNEPMTINCSTCGGGGTPRYQGDYTGIVSNQNVSMSCWSDFRDGHFDSYVAYYPDYAMLLAPEILTMSVQDTFYMNIPAVKDYTDIVLVNTLIEQPATGILSYSYPNGFSLSTFPDSLPIVIHATEDVPVGSYGVTIIAKGPNGTPVHKRYGTVIIVPPDPPVADFSSDTTITCAGSSVNFFDMSSNSPTSWEWTFTGGTPESSTDQNPEGIVYETPGQYGVSLIVTNNAGSNDITKEDYITVNILPDVPLTNDTTTCAGGSVPDLEAQGTDVMWYDDPELTNMVFSGNTFATGQTDPGAYTYYVTQTANGCESPAAMATLEIYNLPEVTLQPLDSACLDLPAYALAGGVPEGGAYEGPGVVDNMFTPSEAGAGTHEIAYIYVDDNGCTDTAYQDLVVNPLPDVSLTEFMGACIDDAPFELIGGFPEGGSYEGTGVADDIFDPAEAGIGSHQIVYSYTDASGCTGSAEASLTVYTLPEISISEDTIVCGGKTADLAAFNENAVSYLWQPGNHSGATYVVDSTGVGFGSQVYTVTVADVNNCVNESSVEVTFNDCTGINENERDIKINVFPNPNEGQFVIELYAGKKETINLKVINVAGETLYAEENIQFKGDLKKSINMTEVADGVLFLIIDNGRYVWKEKIVIH